MFGKRKPRIYLHKQGDTKYKIVEAFILDGVRYFQYEDAFEAATGRQLGAIAIYEEMNMRCSREYLEMHVKAMEKILSNPQKINVGLIARLNQFLKERLELIVLPDYVYKLASVMFFDETESPYTYNFDYNEKKIAKWKAAGGTLDFFSQTPLGKLIPSMRTLGKDLSTYSQVANQIDRIHQRVLSSTLLEEA